MIYQDISRGVYTLIVEIQESIKIIHRSGLFHLLDKGLFTYTGSALGRTSTSLEKRISRHLRDNKKRFWHIDNLLDKGGSIKWIFFANTNTGIECVLNQRIIRIGGANVIKNFGSSDCKSKCGGHLVAFKEMTEDHLLREISHAYRTSDLDPKMMSKEKWGS